MQERAAAAMSTSANEREIDFLPARYREQHVRRRLNVWRLAVVVACGLLVAVGALHQWTVRWAVARELSAIQQRYEAQKDHILKVNMLEDGLHQVQAEARLLAYLAHPWPRTRLLAAVLEPLPQEIRLTDLRIARENIESEGPRSGDQPPPDPNVPVEKPPAQTADLEALHKSCHSTVVVILIEGHVVSADALQKYLSAVADAPLLKSPELQSLASNDEGLTQFKVRIEVMPGIGQPGGPETQRAEEAEVAGVTP